MAVIAGAASGAAVNIVIRAIDNYSKEFKKLDKGVKKQQSSFKKLTGFLASTGLGYAVVAGAAVGFGVDAVKAGLDAERAMQQFELAVGDAAETMLKDMKIASKGMISDFQLIDNANKAMALGIRKSDIPGLLEVATARSKIFGRTATEAFNDLAIGIGRNSRMILDNLGIILDLDKVYGEYAISIGKVTAELTEMDKKAALTTAIMKESEGLIKAQIFLTETHTEKLERLGAGYSNLKQSIGLVILEQFDEISGIKMLEDERQRQIDQMTGIVGTYDITAQSIIELGQAEAELTEELKTSNDAIKNQIDSLLNLKDITFAGERSKTLEVAQQKEIIRQLELREAKGEDIAEQLEEEENKLNILRLQNERFANERIIQSAKIAISLEENGNLEATTFEAFAKNQEEKFIMLTNEEQKNEDIRTKVGEVQTARNNLMSVFETEQAKKETLYDEEEDSIDDLIKKTNKLADAYKDAKRQQDKLENKKTSLLGFLARGFLDIDFPTTTVGDAILRPNGEVIETHPNDTLIATQNPGGIGGGITIVISGDTYGVDADQIAEAFASKIGDSINY